MDKLKRTQVLSWIDCGIFPMSVMFSSGFSYSELMKLLNRKNGEWWKMGIKGDKELLCSAKWITLRRDVTHNNETKTMFYIIFRDGFDFTDSHMSILAHEVLHVCQFGLPDILDRLKEHEAEAYLHSYLMEKILKVLRG